MKEIYDLTNPQKAIWLTEQFYANTPINNVCGTLYIKEKVNFDLFEQAVNLMIEKNDSFNLRFILQKGELKQYIEEYQYHHFKLLNLSSDEELTKYENLSANTPFSIFNSELFNIQLFKLKNGHGGLIINVHHLLADATGMSIISKTIMNLYIALCKNDTDVISAYNPPLYSEYIHQEKEYLSSKRFDNDKIYWEDLFSLVPEIASIPIQNKSENIEEPGASDRKEFYIPENILKKINSFCSDNRVSVFNFFTAIYSFYIGKVSNLTDFSIGTPIFNRTNFKEKNTIGMFISTVPLRIKVDQENSFTSFVCEVAKDSLSMLRHQKYPYEYLLESLRNKDSRVPNLFEVLISYQITTAHDDSLEIPHIVRWTQPKFISDAINIHIHDQNDSGTLTISYDYLIQNYQEADIEDLHTRILTVIQEVIKTPDVPLKEIEILSKEEFHKLLFDFNHTDETYDKKTNIIKLFEKQVEKRPDSIAVVCRDEKLTYKELNEKANILASHLLKKNVKPKDIVAIMLNRYPYLIVSIIAVLKLGATYMPIDPDYPGDRIGYMLENSNAKVLISKNAVLNNFDKIEKETILLDKINFNDKLNCDNHKIEIPSDTLSYIMYTSGSTGLPKAVSIKHHNVINFNNFLKKTLNYNPDNNSVLSVTTICFDIFVFELFPTLLNGLQLVLATEEESKNPELLNNLIVKENVKKLLTTPSRVQLLFLDSKYLKCLTVLEEIILGGEPFPADLLEQLQQITKAKLYNFYGPTETTVYSTYKELTNSTEITIGRPIDNTQIYILDNNHKLLPTNQIGEICIGGEGVGPGYYNNPELTSQAFVRNPYKENDIIYKTGDLGKWNENGELYCFGRKDFQIKLHGYRIELDDINSNILEFPDIQKSVVTPKTDKHNNPVLCAYIIGTKKINITKLRNFLLKKLPNYMVPTYIMQLDEFPLTINHKIDKKSLPDPEDSNNDMEEQYEAPSTAIQKVLCNIIAQELGIEKIGISSDLFKYSLDSLTIIRIQVKLLPYEYKLSTQDFYKWHNIKELSSVIENNSKKKEKHPESTTENLEFINSVYTKHTKEPITLHANTYNCIILTGSTGFLGIHMLKDLIETTSAKIICPIRGKDGHDPQRRLLEKYQYYFKEHLDLNRIEVLEIDLRLDRLDLDDDTYEKLAENVDLIINTVANVRYYGDYSDFKLVNVKFVDILTNFAIKNNIKFVHISTLGVSGNYLVTHNKENIHFSENDFYIGQNYKENVYIQTKFEAEKVIYDKTKLGLKSTILRVGNLTGRNTDGQFQENIEENAFYNILRVLINYKIIPDSMLEQMLEFTPVDLCSKACLQIIFQTLCDNMVFHVFNNNYISLKDLLPILLENNYQVDTISGNDYYTKINELSKGKNNNILKGIVNDLDIEKGLSFKASIIQENKDTNTILQQLNFNWPQIDKTYIEKILFYMKEKKYIN